MELKEYFQILKKAKTQILTTTLLVIIVAFLGALFWPKQIEANFSLYLTKKTQATSSEFEYDQYYTLKTEEKLGKFIEEYLKNPAVSSEILKKTKVSSKDYYLPFRKHFFQAHTLSAPEVQINFKLKNPDKAEKLVAETHRKLNQTFEELFSKNDQTRYRLKRSPVSLSRPGPALSLSALLGALGGFFLAIFIALFRHYLD